MTTPAEFRRRAQVKRNIGKALILVAIIAAFVLAYVLVLGVDVIGASSTMFTNCGFLADPVDHSGFEGEVCATALGEQSVLVWISGGIAAVAGAIGITILVRVPRF